MIKDKIKNLIKFLLKKNYFRYFVIAMLYLLIGIMVFYVVFRLILLIQATYFWQDKLYGIILLLTEVFIIMHSLGYINEILRVFLFYNDPLKDRPEVPELKTNPYVAVLIPSYKEPLEVIEDTISTCYNMSYKNKDIILLDDTRYDQNPDESLFKYKTQIEELCKKFNISLFRRKWRGAKAGIINDYLSFIQNNNNPEFNFQTFEEDEQKKKNVFTKPKYIVIFDADQNPETDFIEPLVALSEEDSRLALIQTPQYYTNFQNNKIARAAALQQVIFYEYICAGKGIKEAVLCCGSNVLLRVDALLEVRGFDEASITEDASTSLLLHLRGWKTKYYNKVCAFGMGPEDLGNYFKQQFRWGAGGIELFKKVVKAFIKNPRKLKVSQWWEYFLSTTFYFSGLAYLILWIYPIVYLLFGVPSFFANPFIYGIAFLPYVVFTTFIFFYTLRKRNYSNKNLMEGQFLLLMAFPVFIEAAFAGLFGRKRKFEITSKKNILTYPYLKLWPQIIFGIICFIAIIWGLNRMYYERIYLASIFANIFWTIYNFAIMISIFYFNAPLDEKTLKEKKVQNEQEKPPSVQQGV